MSRRSPEVLVPFLGLLYIVLVLLYVVVSTNFSGFSLSLIPLIALFLAGAYGVWRRGRIGFVGSLILSLVFLGLFGIMIFDALSAVTIPGEFISVVTAVPILVAVLIYSILGLRMVWSKGATPKPPRMIPASSVVVLLVLGFIFGGILIGLVAAQTETRLLNSSTPADVTIVAGAGNQGNPQYFTPANFTVKVGVAVTWVNHDGTAHTVTSKGSNLFDSGNVRTGELYKYTFTQPGTYQYYCTLHPWMTGTIIVTSS